MGYPVTLIRGDGSDLEVAEATCRAIAATGVAIDWHIVDAGHAGRDGPEIGLLVPILNALRHTKTALRGPLSGPAAQGFHSIKGAIGQEFNLYASLSLAKSIPGAPGSVHDLDLVIVQDTTEDLYAGLEFERTTLEAAEARELLAKLAKQPIRDDAAIAVRPISVLGSRQIAEFAFEYARATSRRQVTAVHQSDLMPCTDGLFLEIAQEVGHSYPNIGFADQTLSTLCGQLMQTPNRFDILVMPNLYGDIVANLCAGLIGGPSMTPSAHCGDDYAVFEPLPTPANQTPTTPAALMLAGALMLEHLGENEAAQKLRLAVETVIAEGKQVTADFAPQGTKPVAPQEMAAAIIQALT